MQSLESRYLRFELAGQDWAVDIAQVLEIVPPLPVTPVPRSGEIVVGAFNLRGRVLPLLDPRRALGLEAGDPQDGVFVVLTREGSTYAVLVDCVHDVVCLPEESLSPPPDLPGGAPEVLDKVGRDEERLLFIVDLGRLLAA